jgi:hypothetical protein
VCSTFTSVAEVDERRKGHSLPSRSRPWRSEGPSSSEETRAGRTAALRPMEGVPGRRKPAPFMRSGGRRPTEERQRRTCSHAESEEDAASRADQGDSKRVKRHESRHSPLRRVKTRRAVGDVELGCSFFEKWVFFARKFRRISWRSRLLAEAPFETTSTPASRSRRSVPVRVELWCGASRFELFRNRGATRAAVTPPFRANGRGASSALHRTAKPGATRGCSGQSGSAWSLRGYVLPPPSSGATPGGARFADRKR